MKNPITLNFSSAELTRKNITGNLPDDCKYRIPYANTDLIELKEGVVICQHYSHILYFMEVIEFKLHTDLYASFSVDKPSLFQFFMLQGKIAFFTPDRQPIAQAGKGICYATYNEPSEYFYHLPAGTHRTCCFTLRPRWLQMKINSYLGLNPFVEKMDDHEVLYGHMPSCMMNKKISDDLLALFNLMETVDNDLESAQSRILKRLITEYQKLVKAKLSHPIYLIRDYLEENYKDPSLNNEMLLEKYSITKKTLIRKFRKEFGLAPHAYLTSVRMKHAQLLLAKEKRIVNEVYGAVGYKDIHSFGIQFRKFFGFPPSDYH
ncbi:MAG: helix-turn-helix domain-containing protein [Sphingobacteriales bacterium]